MPTKQFSFKNKSGLQNNQVFQAYDFKNNFQILAQVPSDILDVISLFLGYQQALNLIQIVPDL